MKTELQQAFESGDSGAMLVALNNEVNARGTAEVSSSAGVDVAMMFKMLSQHGNQEFKTMVAVLRALGLQLAVKDL